MLSAEERPISEEIISALGTSGTSGKSPLVLKYACHGYDGEKLVRALSPINPTVVVPLI
jgi:hypothetical protein